MLHNFFVVTNQLVNRLLRSEWKSVFLRSIPRFYTRIYRNIRLELALGVDLFLIKDWRLFSYIHERFRCNYFFFKAYILNFKSPQKSTHIRFFLFTKSLHEFHRNWSIFRMTKRSFYYNDFLTYMTMVMPKDAHVACQQCHVCRYNGVYFGDARCDSDFIMCRATICWNI